MSLSAGGYPPDALRSRTAQGECQRAQEGYRTAHGIAHAPDLVSLTRLGRREETVAAEERQACESEDEDDPHEVCFQGKGRSVTRGHVALLFAITSPHATVVRMKLTGIFSIAHAAAIVLFCAGQALHDDPSAFWGQTFLLCVLTGVLLQLSAFAISGAQKLRWVSAAWLLIAIVLASAESVEFSILVAVFFGGFAFSFVPKEKLEA